jgi:high-affinity iron transporter
MKMKFIFILKQTRGPAGLALMLALALCGCGTPRPGPAAGSEAPDGSDAQRLVALVDYIGGDYGGAVSSAGDVTAPSEYEEQLRFAADAKTMAGRLLAGAADDDLLLTHVTGIESLVAAKADPKAVAQACRAAREEAVARFQVRTMPRERPSLPRAEALYAQACAQCHGPTGNADTPRAATLDPHPAKFKDPARLGELSPYRVYNALTFGVSGTAMAAFEDLSPTERWSLAFYVFRLGHEGETGVGPVAMTLADLAVRSDSEVLAVLKSENHPNAEGALVYARREAAFTEPPTGVGIDRTRAMLRQAVAAYTGGRAREADGLVIDAYLEGFEPLEPRLRARDAQATLDVETAFRDLRAAMAGAETADRVRARGQALDSRIARLGDGRSRPPVPILAAFIIYFREGIEAALLVGALLAGLRRLGRTDASRFVHVGWLLALPAGLATWWVLDRVVSLGADKRELMEAGVSLLAACVLFSVSFWLISKAEARHWMGYLKTRLEAGLSRKSLYVISGLAFLAVYREAAETVLFTQALVLESEAQRGQVWLGAAAGLATVMLVAFVMSRTVLRLPLGPFFTVSSLLMCALAVSFAGAGIYELVASGYLPPRPVAFPEVPWMGIHPDLTGLVVQLAIVLVIAGAGIATLRKRPLEVR